ncbi:MAG: zinc ribbon domain-containing protein [Thermodesulfobacteriota bacterium]
MLCKNCKKQIDKTEKFCGYCGANTKEVNFILKSDTHTRNDFSHSYNHAEENSNHGEVTVGIVILLVGIALTWITYEAASGGGTYFVFWGLIIYGGYKILKGLAS